MTTYIIKKWAETIDCHNVLKPMFTFVPDDLFLEYLLTQSGPILIEILDCPVYNGLHYAMCISSADFPSFGPNYYDVTKEYTMIVDTSFTLFPNKNEYGKFRISMNIRSFHTIDITSDDDKKKNPSIPKNKNFKETFRKNKNVKETFQKEDQNVKEEEMIVSSNKNCGCAKGYSPWLMIGIILFICVVLSVLMYTMIKN